MIIIFSNYLLSVLIINGFCFGVPAAYIQLCRGLMISAVCLGFFGAILALVGMKCTKIGGPETTKARITCLCGLHFILSGKWCLTMASCFSFSVIDSVL